jgi:hypothetical protein
MMLHINILKLHVVNLDTSSASAVFLSIHAGGSDFCISTSLFEFNTAVFNQALHVALEGCQATEITLMASILLSNGQFESRGKCNFLCSEKDHGLIKQIGLLGGEDQIRLQSSIVLSCTYESLTINIQSPSVVSHFMTPVALEAERLGSQRLREAEFILARADAWGQDRALAFDKRKEGVVASTASRPYASGSRHRPIAQQPRAGARDLAKQVDTAPRSAKKPDTAPKLRRTTMNVGYVTFWPDKDDVAVEEDKLLLKLRMAEERRQAILREAEAKIRARNIKLDSHIEEIKHRKPDPDLFTLRKVLAEKERQITSMQQLVASLSRGQVEKLLRGISADQHHPFIYEGNRHSFAGRNIRRRMVSSASRPPKSSQVMKRNCAAANKKKRPKKKAPGKAISRIKMRRNRNDIATRDDKETSDDASLDLYSQIEALKSDIKGMCDEVVNESILSSQKRAAMTPARELHPAEGVQLISRRPVRAIAANTSTKKKKVGKTPKKQSPKKSVSVATSVASFPKSIPRYSSYIYSDTHYMRSKLEDKSKASFEPARAPLERTRRANSAHSATASFAQKIRPPSVDVRRKEKPKQTSPHIAKLQSPSKSMDEFQPSSFGHLLSDGEDVESALQRFLLDTPSTNATHSTEDSPSRSGDDIMAEFLQHTTIKQPPLEAPTPNDHSSPVFPPEGAPAAETPTRPLRELEVRA